MKKAFLLILMMAMMAPVLATPVEVLSPPGSKVMVTPSTVAPNPVPNRNVPLPPGATSSYYYGNYGYGYGYGYGAYQYQYPQPQIAYPRYQGSGSVNVAPGPASPFGSSSTLYRSPLR